jgi:hypothetical protein
MEDVHGLHAPSNLVIELDILQDAVEQCQNDVALKKAIVQRYEKGIEIFTNMDYNQAFIALLKSNKQVAINDLTEAENALKRAENELSSHVLHLREEGYCYH